jgi:hypothetical protein
VFQPPSFDLTLEFPAGTRAGFAKGTARTQALGGVGGTGWDVGDGSQRAYAGMSRQPLPAGHVRGFAEDSDETCSTLNSRSRLGEPT